MRHIIPMETKVSFKFPVGGSLVYVVDSYPVLLHCDPDCSLDHDHYEEPYICVRQESHTAFPLSQLDHIFDQPHHVGRKATVEERTPTRI
jgi:hypothetical protein